LALKRGSADSARVHAERALEWGPWSDLARIVLARAKERQGDAAGADSALAPVRERIQAGTPPEYVYRTKLSTWESVHELPAWERAMVLAESKTGGAQPPK
jgi:hypothetical protein